VLWNGDLESPLGVRCSRLSLDIVRDAGVTALLGGASVDGVRLRTQDGAEKDLAVDGVFIESADAELGSRQGPGTTRRRGPIEVDCSSCTSQPGIFAAGDVTTTFAEQVLIAIGTGPRRHSAPMIPPHPSDLRQQSSSKENLLPVDEKGEDRWPRR